MPQNNSVRQKKKKHCYLTVNASYPSLTTTLQEPVLTSICYPRQHRKNQTHMNLNSQALKSQQWKLDGDQVNLSVSQQRRYTTHKQHHPPQAKRRVRGPRDISKQVQTRRSMSPKHSSRFCKTLQGRGRTLNLSKATGQHRNPSPTPSHRAKYTEGGEEDKEDKKYWIVWLIIYWGNQMLPTPLFLKLADEEDKQNVLDLILTTSWRSTRRCRYGHPQAMRCEAMLWTLYQLTELFTLLCREQGTTGKLCVPWRKALAGPSWGTILYQALLWAPARFYFLYLVFFLKNLYYWEYCRSEKPRHREVK